MRCTVLRNLCPNAVQRLLPNSVCSVLINVVLSVEYGLDNAMSAMQRAVRFEAN